MGNHVPDPGWGAVMEGVLRRAWQRGREAWDGLLAAPGGPEFVARGIGAGAFAAMLPAFGLHLVLAGATAFLARGSITAAGAACLLIGNPLTHTLLIPTEYAIGRFLLQRTMHPHPVPATGIGHWVELGLPALEELLTGGIVLGVPAGLLAWALARPLLRRRAALSAAQE